MQPMRTTFWKILYLIFQNKLKYSTIILKQLIQWQKRKGFIFLIKYLQCHIIISQLN